MNRLAGVEGEPHSIFAENEKLDFGCIRWQTPSDEDSNPLSQEIRKLDSALLEAASRGDHEIGKALAQEVINKRRAWQTLGPEEKLSPIYWSARKIAAEHRATAYRDFGWENWNKVTLRAIVIAPVVDPYEVLRIEHTTANNRGLNTEQLISKLRVIDSELGIDIIGAAIDAVEFLIDTIPEGKEAVRWGRWLQRLCPDLPQRPKLSARHIALWWD